MDFTEGPGHLARTDEVATARALFAALDAVPPSLFGESDVGLVTGAAGTLISTATDISCEGQGEVATCKGKRDDGKTFTVGGAEGLALARAFDLIGASQHAMGGSFKSSVSYLACLLQGNGAIDATLPASGIAHGYCEMTVDDRTLARLGVDDAPPRAEAPLDSLVKAGLDPEHAAGGLAFVQVDRITCRKGPDAPTTCTITGGQHVR